MKYAFSFLSVLLTVFYICGCGSVKTAESITILTWNTQTFFDAVECGREFPEFSGSRSRWNTARYEQRLDKLCTVILNSEASFEDGQKKPELKELFRKTRGPDIAVLEEIENSGVLRDIVNRLDYRCGYQYAAFASGQESAFGCAVLSRLPIVRAASHSVFSGNSEDLSARPILEVEFCVGKSSITLFICHWKSKSGGGEELRRLQENALGGCIFCFETQTPGSAVIALGDFNRTLDEFISADNTKAALTGWKYVKLSSLQGNPVYAASPWPMWLEQNTERIQGSYWYGNRWETIDHIFITENTLAEGTIRPQGFAVVHSGPHITGEGIPHRYEVFSGNGYSDHLPLILRLKVQN